MKNPKLKRITVYIGYGDAGQSILDRLHTLAIAEGSTTGYFVRSLILKALSAIPVDKK